MIKISEWIENFKKSKYISTSKDLTISKFLSFHNEYTLTIPSYQRLYVWSEKKYNHILENFLNDVNFSINEKKPFHIGTIFCTTKENSNKNIYIIDGQQRIMTIALLLKKFQLDIVKIKRDPIHTEELKNMNKEEGDFYKYLHSGDTNNIKNSNLITVLEMIKKIKFKKNIKIGDLKISFTLVILKKEISYDFFVKLNTNRVELKLHELINSLILNYISINGKKEIKDTYIDFLSKLKKTFLSKTIKNLELFYKNSVIMFCEAEDILDNNDLKYFNLLKNKIYSNTSTNTNIEEYIIFLHSLISRCVSFSERTKNFYELLLYVDISIRRKYIWFLMFCNEDDKLAEIIFWYELFKNLTTDNGTTITETNKVLKKLNKNDFNMNNVIIDFKTKLKKFFDDKYKKNNEVDYSQILSVAKKNRNEIHIKLFYFLMYYKEENTIEDDLSFYIKNCHLDHVHPKAKANDYKWRHWMNIKYITFI